MPSSYNFSLTGVYLLLPQCRDLAELYEEWRDWDLVKEKVREGNLLRGQREETNKKRLRVLTERMSTLSEDEWEVFFEGTLEDQRQLAMIGAARVHAILREFVVEILREKFLVYDTHLPATEFESFWRHKVALHPDLESITDTTQRKIRNVTFNMLVEAGWLEGSLTKGFVITPPVPGTRLARVLARQHPEWLLFFCLPDQDIRYFHDQFAEDE